MQLHCPKQYLSLAGVAILQHTLNTLTQVDSVAKVIVALAKNDDLFDQLACAHHPLVHRIEGGTTRASSVLAALHSINAQTNDWVLVHDAARPLISLNDIHKLLKAVAHHPVGGILATPVIDTLKQVSSAQEIIRTLPRQDIWRALTPQCFRFAVLTQALEHCLAQQIEATDEAMAVECLGYKPLIVEGASDNIKITYPIDLVIAEQLYRSHLKTRDFIMAK